MKRETVWQLDPQGILRAPGLTALVFHNAYPGGKQGGIEIIQHGERVMTCGDLRLSSAPTQWDILPETSDRISEAGSVSVPGRFPGAGLAYVIHVEPAGSALQITVELEGPLPASLVGCLGFNIEIYPGTYMGKAYWMGSDGQGETLAQGVFPRQFNGPRVRDPEGTLSPLAMGQRLVIAPEDPLHRLEVRSLTGTLSLYDGRGSAQNGWFVLREVIAPDAERPALVWLIEPHSEPDWRRPPVLCVSQVGYHPEQVKQVLLELDPRTEDLEPVTLERITPDGPQMVKRAVPSRWGRFLAYDYAVFDFSEVREPGLYRVCYQEEVSAPFTIDPQVYQRDVWQPTLDVFLPVQMCHMRVQDRYRVWHGVCHLDDALQAPVSHRHFDGYRQYDTTETPYRPGEHVPHLDRGGWHDAGDYDLATGSQANTTHILALIRELFQIDTDHTTVDRERRLVVLHTPDGIPDILHQVAHGVEILLGGYRAAGHSFQGIIAATLDQYVHLGDASTMTDNRVYVDAPSLGDEATQAGADVPRDDRWVFTNHDTALEYLVAAALAAASRVLDAYDASLAQTCLATAQGVWQTEQGQEPVSHPGAYVPRDREAQEVLAAVELYLATGETQYADRLRALWPTVESHLWQLGGHVARALQRLGDATLVTQLREAIQAQLPAFSEELGRTPFGIPFHPHIWGIGWQLLSQAVQLYQLWTLFPDLIDRELILRIVQYNLGWHPASNTSLVSGVGAHSATVAYGTNRADWSYIPGGVISGPALIRPDLPELKEPWPFLWQQTEYVIGGAANFIFSVLAADRILNG